MGVLAPGSKHAGPSAQPPTDMSGNFLPNVSRELLTNIFPNCLDLISKVSEIFLKNLKTPPSGARGGSQCFWGVYISFFG